MGTTAPWRFSNYMGEFASDADVATALSALGFSASSGMVYYNTTRPTHRFYRNGAWRDRLARERELVDGDDALHRVELDRVGGDFTLCV